MATIRLAWYAQNPDTGQGIAGVRVRAYPVNLDNTRGASYRETTTNTRGYFSLVFTTDELPSPTGLYEVELYNATTGQTAIIHPDAEVQLKLAIGPDGAAPIPDLSIVTAKIGDAAVTDAKIGNRTLYQAISTAYSNTAQLGTILSWFAKRLKEVLGTTNWSDAVPITLTALAAHKSRHASGGADALTPADIGAVAKAGDTMSGTLNAPGLQVNGNNVIHAGNIGSQSVANADTVDSHHASSFGREIVGDYIGNATSNRTINLGFTPNRVTIVRADTGWLWTLMRAQDGTNASSLVYSPGVVEVRNVLAYISIVTNGFQVNRAGDIQAGANENNIRYIYNAYANL